MVGCAAVDLRKKLVSIEVLCEFLNSLCFSCQTGGKGQTGQTEAMSEGGTRDSRTQRRKRESEHSPLKQTSSGENRVLDLS